MATRETRGRCPSCGKSFRWGENALSRPFCSERCRLVDLGDWLDERHRIPDGESSEPFTPPRDDAEL